MAVDLLKSRGVPEDRILFLNVIASPEGVTSFAQRYPKLRVVTAFVDQGLDEKKCVPGLGAISHRADHTAHTAHEILGTSFLGWEISEIGSIHYKKRLEAMLDHGSIQQFTCNLGLDSRIKHVDP